MLTGVSHHLFINPPVWPILLSDITNHLMTGPLGNSEFCFPRISMFPSTSSRETFRFLENKIHCSPRDQSLSVYYYTTQGVRRPITKIDQWKCSIAGPIFSKYWTGHCPEWSRTCVFAVFAFFSRVINLLSTKHARNRTGRISALGLFYTNLAALGPYCQDLGPIFSQYGPRSWLIRYIYWPSVVFVRTSLRLVRTATTSGQYSAVRPSRSVSKRLIFFVGVVISKHRAPGFIDQVSKRSKTIKKPRVGNYFSAGFLIVHWSLRSELQELLYRCTSTHN